jgi:hypothetical protein
VTSLVGSADRAVESQKARRLAFLAHPQVRQGGADWFRVRRASMNVGGRLWWGSELRLIDCDDVAFSVTAGKV